MTIQEHLTNFDFDVENIVFFANPTYESALIGISTNDRAVYDYDKMVQYLLDTTSMSEDECIDFIHYNTIRSCDYIQNGPIIMFPVSYEEDEIQYHKYNEETNFSENFGSHTPLTLDELQEIYKENFDEK